MHHIYVCVCVCVYIYIFNNCMITFSSLLLFYSSVVVHSINRSLRDKKFPQVSKPLKDSNILTVRMIFL